MGNYLSLVVPETDQTVETIEAYYRFYFDQMEPYLAETEYRELSEYEFARQELTEHDLFHVSERVFHSIGDNMDPSIGELFVQHDCLHEEVVTYKYVLADLVRVFEETREQFSETDSLEDHHDRALQSYITLLTFAIEHGYGISFP